MIYAPSCNGVPEGDEYMTWLSHWRFGSHEVGPGDEVNIFVFSWHRNTSFEVKEVGIHLVYDEQEQAGDHPEKRQRIQQNYVETSHFVIPVELQATTHRGTTQLYFLGSNLVRTDWLLESIFRRICFGCGRRICTRCGRKLVTRAIQSWYLTWMILSCTQKNVRSNVKLYLIKRRIMFLPLEFRYSLAYVPGVLNFIILLFVFNI